MRLSKLWVENFRAAKDLSLELKPTTGLLGENNGKSSILAALNLFFDPAPRIQQDDFFARDVSLTITISIEFCELTPDEYDRFGGNLINGKLRVARTFNFGSAKENGRYFVEAEVLEEFSKCRSIEKANDKRDEYRRLQSLYPELPNVSRAEDIDDELENGKQTTRLN